MTAVEKISARELASKWNGLKNQESGWAFYRFPGSTKVNFIGGKVTGSSIDKKPVNGFVIAPFFNPQNQLWYIENALQYLLIDNDFTNMDPDFVPALQDFNDEKSDLKNQYEKLVSNVLVEIKKGTIKKAVPARVKQVVLEPGFSPFKLYESLLEAYPTAFVYFLNTPQTGTWIGCTPERLLQVNNDEINTMSLAGTKKTIELTKRGFSAKETEEQAIVTRYINDILTKFCTQIVSDGPHSIKAGNVTHLATYFKAVLKPEYHHNYMPMLKDLHPTPAVCGIPLNISRDFLLKHEEFDRALYSGFLGPVSDTKADIFVNLRCMQVFNQSALLYAGAGVVEGSIPEKEWFETEEKMNTLLRFL
jgi:isochorismate synthase